MNKLVRITTVPISLQKLISGQMRYMAEHGYQVYMISSDFDGKFELEKKEGALFIPVNMTRTISPFSDLKSLYHLIKILREIKPQIVHTHTPKAGLLGMLASWIVRVPVRLHTVAGLPLMETRGVKRRILEFVEQITYALSTKVYPNSKNLKEFIVQRQFTKPFKLKVLGNGSSNGINTNFFKRSLEIDLTVKQLVKEYSLSSANFNFIFIGRLVKDKGIEELVAAFSSLSSKYKNIRLILVGPEERDLDPLSDSCIEEMTTNEAILSIGFQNDVRPYLAMSHVLTFPSYREGFPNVPLQAGCFNLPLIVTDINGCNEIVIEGQNGLIIPVKDTEALRLAMEKLYLDTDLYNHMVGKSRQMIVSRYEQSKIWELLHEEYAEHLKNRKIV